MHCTGKISKQKVINTAQKLSLTNNDREERIKELNSCGQEISSPLTHL